MIDISKVLRQTAKFNAVSIVSALVQIPTQIIIGIFLLPEEYGVVSLVGLWSLYSGLINPGILNAGQREIPYLIGKQDFNESIRIQNISISSDFIYSFLPFLVILCSSFIYQNQIIKNGLIITAFYFLINRIPTYWSSINFVRQKFSIVAIGKLISILLSPLIIISLISIYGVYSVLITPIICAIITGLYFIKKGPIRFKINLEWKETLRLIKAGYILSLIGIIFYGYRMVDSTIIAAFLPLNDLGLFSYAMGLIVFSINILADFGRVLEPIIWEKSGKNDSNESSFYDTKEIIVYIAIITAMIIPFAQICYCILIKYFVPKYFESLSIFIILSSMLYLATMPIIPNIILNSVAVNKQKIVAEIYSLGFIINIIFDLIIIKYGYGIKAIALITIISQCAITVLLYLYTFRYIFDKNINKILFLLSLIFPFLISIIFTLVHYHLNNYLFNNNSGVIISIIFQIIIWSLLILVFYDRYFPKKLIIDYIKRK